MDTHHSSDGDHRHSPGAENRSNGAGSNVFHDQLPVGALDFRPDLDFARVSTVIHPSDRAD